MDIDIYIPVYMKGQDGKQAYHFAKLTGEITGEKCPEGAVCINSRAMTAVPPERLQPPARGLDQPELDEA